MSDEEVKPPQAGEEDVLPPLGSGAAVKPKPDRVTQGLIVAVMLGMALLGFQQYRESEQLKKGTQAPDFTGTRANGAPVQLSNFDGQVVVLDFWAAYCGPCREEMPSLVQTVESLRGKGVVFLAVNTEEPNYPGSRANGFMTKAVPELEQYAVFAHPIVTEHYHVVALPTLIVLDPHRHVVATRMGPVTDSELRGLIEQAKKAE